MSGRSYEYPDTQRDAVAIGLGIAAIALLVAAISLWFTRPGASMRSIVASRRPWQRIRTPAKVWPTARRVK